MKLKNEIKIGLLAVVIIVAFIWGVLFIKGSNILSRNAQYYAVYSDAGGIASGRSVTLNGVRVGEVKSIGLDVNDYNRVVVGFEVSKNYRLSKNTIAIIASGPSLTSENEIQLDMRKGSPAESGDTLQGAVSSGMFDKIIGVIEPIKNELVKGLVELDSLLVSLNDVFSEENRQRLNSSFASLEGTMNNVEAVSDDINDVLTKNKDNLNTMLAELSSGSAKLNTVLDSVQKADIGKTMRNFNTASADLALITGRMSGGKGSLGRLLTEDTLAVNLEKSTASLNDLLTDLKANPKRYVHFSLFGSGGKTKEERKAEKHAKKATENSK